MSVSSITPPRRPRRWGLITAIVVVVIALLTATVVVANALGGDDENRSAPTSSASGQPTSAATNGTAAAPSQAPQGGTADKVDGCLGGPDPSTAIKKATTAPLTTAGAVEFTVTVVRWTMLSSLTDLNRRTYGPQVMSKSQYQRFIATWHDASSEDRSVTSWGDFGKGHYSVEFNRDQATVSLGGTLHATKSGEQKDASVGGVYELRAVHGKWQLQSSASGDHPVTYFQQLNPLPGGC